MLGLVNTYSCTRAQGMVRDVWEWLHACAYKLARARARISARDYRSRCQAQGLGTGLRSRLAAIVKVWFPECPLFGGKNTWQKRFGTKDSVRCSEFRGGRFLEVANVLQVWDFQSVTRTLSALGSVSASRSVRSGRFYCMT